MCNEGKEPQATVHTIRAGSSYGGKLAEDGLLSKQDELAAKKKETKPAANEIGAQEFLRAMRAASSWLDAHIAEVNALNVFPVPDGDTGTNMSLTLQAAIKEVGEEPLDSVGALARKLAHGALMGARGNSGVILSQILRGFARYVDGQKTIDTQDIAHALVEGAQTAYQGVMEPVEGTMLTVIREAAEAAVLAAEAQAPLEQMLEHTLAEARASLSRTPSLLPVLAAAGVVDAGGKGLVLILEGILRALQGMDTASLAAEAREGARVAEAPTGEYNYDTQFIIQGNDLDVIGIREQIAQLGDSVLVVGDSKTVKVHVHCDHPGEALEIGLAHGHITEVIIENMQLQYEAFVRAAQSVQPEEAVSAPAAPSDATPVTEIGVVAVASGKGLQQVFETLGAGAVVAGGQTMNPSTQDLLAAIENLPQSQVVILPNNKNIIMAAQQAVAMSTKEAVVVPTKTIPQGIAALLALNYQAGLAENVEAMQQAAERIHSIEVTQAVRDAQVNGLSIQEGQFIGLLDDDLRSAEDSPFAVISGLLESLPLADLELVAIYYGQDVTADQAQALTDALQERFPMLEFEVLEGGQAHYHYIISVE